ncbi:MAG: choice-of-anchor J domain-containing protein, partial [Muribaculaceae bacterium]
APASATATYSVVVKNGDDVSSAVSASVYVGLDTPTAPTNLVATTAGHTVTLTWDAPATGVNGNMLDPATLTYTVTRIQGEESTVVATDLAATEFSETLDFTGLITVKYTVTATLGTNTGDAATSADIMMGSVELPLADSFAGAKFADFWTSEIVNGTYNWEVASSSSSPSGTPVDADGGLAVYKSYSARKNESARLMTPPIDHATASNPVVEYYMLHHSSGADVLKLQVSIDGGDWIDVPGGENTVKKDGYSSGQWEKVNVSLSSVIPADCSSFRVAFTTVSAWGYNTVIDAVRIFNLKGKDLAITGFQAPAEAISGNDAVITISVANNSGADVAAADYSVALIHTFPGVIADVETVDVPALSSVDLTVTVPITALEAFAAESFTIKAELTFDGDEDLANNASDEATVAMAFLDYTPATNLVRGEDTAEGLATISWTPAQDPEYVPVNITESFEDFAKGDAGPYNGFVVLDLDGKAGSNCYSASGSILVVTEPNASTPGNPDGSKVLGVTCAGNVQQDDWLISPAISCPEGSSMNMSFLIGFKGTSSFTNKFEVVYATDEYDPASPATAFTNLVQKFESTTYTTTNPALVSADYNLHQVSVTGIPAEAKYIAIHINTKTLASYYEPAVWIDNVVIAEAIDHPLAGYRVYDLTSGLLTEELLPTSQTSFTVPASEADRILTVVAVYTEGEAQPSNPVVISAPEEPDFVLTLDAADSYTVGSALPLDVCIQNRSDNDISIDGENYIFGLKVDETSEIRVIEVGTLLSGQQAAGTIYTVFGAMYRYNFEALTLRLVLLDSEGTELAASAPVTVALQYAEHSAPEEVTLFFDAVPKALAWNEVIDLQGGTVLGYNVYVSTSFEALNAELIPAEATTFDLSDESYDETATYLVSAVFADGESPLTAAEMKSGILDLTTDDAADAEFYNLQGIRVANPTPGTIYIVRRGTTATKQLAK